MFIKRLIFLFASVVLFFTSCENGLNNEGNEVAPSTPGIELSQQIIDVDFESAVYSISISSPYSWKAVSDNDWIIVENNIGIAGTSILSFKVLLNTEDKERRGSIIIANSSHNLIVEFYVIQKAFIPQISIASESLTFATEGGTQEIAINANFEYNVIEDYDWISVIEKENLITISATSNYNIKERSAEIIISNEQYGITKKVNVFQNCIPLEDAERIILYTSCNGSIIEPYAANIFGANIKSNIYKNGIGIMMFDAPITKIGVRAFLDCTLLKNIIIPNSATSIGSYAFSGCTSLQSIVIPNSITSIGHYAFYGCESLTDIIIPNNITKIADYTFCGCESILSISIPNSITEIGKYAFAGCTSMTSIIIPDSVTKIGNAAFAECESLTSVVMPSNITTIADETFYCCYALMNISIPNNISSIGWDSFWGCKSLISITIPNNVTSIGDSTFKYCSSLKAVYCKPTIPPTGYSYTFDNNDPNRKIYVPSNSVEAYKSAEGWKDYADDIVGYDF